MRAPAAPHESCRPKALHLSRQILMDCRSRCRFRFPKSRARERARRARRRAPAEYSGASKRPAPADRFPDAIFESRCRAEARAGARPLPFVPHADARHERSEEHTSELQSPYDLVCRLLLEKKKKKKTIKQ